MSFQVAPPSHHRDGPPEDGNVDRLLRAFYKAEMPDPWPMFEPPAETPVLLPFPAPPARRPLFSRSRLALAASIALLMGGLGLLSGKFGTDAPKTSGPRMIGEGATRTLPGSTVPPGSDVQFKGPFLDGVELKVIIEEAPIGPGR